MLQEQFEKDYEIIDEELLELSTLQQLESSMTLPLVIDSPKPISRPLSIVSIASTLSSDLRRSKRINKSPISKDSLQIKQSASNYNFVPNSQLILVQNKKKWFL